MTLYYEDEGKIVLPFDCEKLAEEVICAALDYIGCPYEAELNLLLTENEQIQSMNKEFRGIDSATDVLSFPAADYDAPGDFSFFEDRDEYFNPETGELVLGDIVISKERLLSQADEYGHTPRREFSFLIVHSVLHLSGYDHMEEEERVHMEELQRAVLEKLNILR